MQVSAEFDPAKAVQIPETQARRTRFAAPAEAGPLSRFNAGSPGAAVVMCGAELQWLVMTSSSVGRCRRTGMLDLEGVNLVLCAVEQPISEGRDSFLVGAVPRLLPVPIRDVVHGLAHDGSGRDLVDLRYVPLTAGDPAILARPAEGVQHAGRRSPHPIV